MDFGLQAGWVWAFVRCIRAGTESNPDAAHDVTLLIALVFLVFLLGVVLPPGLCLGDA